jgi:dihydrofolate reductase / thymidylate synthase
MSEKPKTFDIIVAMDSDGVIGLEKDGVHTIYWPQIERDMKFFRETTRRTQNPKLTNAIIVGHNTWNTLGPKYRSASGRTHYVVSRDVISEQENVIVFPTFEQVLSAAQTNPLIENIYVIGGAAIYRQALDSTHCLHVYTTVIETSLRTSQYAQHRKIMFPIKPQNLRIALEPCGRDIIGNDGNSGLSYRMSKYNVDMFTIMTKYFEPPTETCGERQYLALVEKVFRSGIVKHGRNGNTLSIFGSQLIYDLDDGFPLLTVRKSFPRMIFEELMWMIRGQTDSKILEAKNIRAWMGNSTLEFIRSRGLPYREGDIGPGYGFQMRHYGAEYRGCDADYTGQGVDQLTECIRLLRTDPMSRRIIIDLWNPSCLNEMALPPCHVMYNFYVEDTGNRKRLNCHLFQRSWDIIVGWNTGTAAFLTLLLAHHCGFEPGRIVHSISDIHLYQCHIDDGVVQTILTRQPFKPPHIKVINKHENIEDYTYEDIAIDNYVFHPAIKITMVA